MWYIYANFSSVHLNSIFLQVEFSYLSSFIFYRHTWGNSVRIIVFKLNYTDW
jgi:hypothetical protein